MASYLSLKGFFQITLLFNLYLKVPFHKDFPYMLYSFLNNCIRNVKMDDRSSRQWKLRQKLRALKTKTTMTQTLCLVNALNP